MAHASDSLVQRDAEPLILAAASAALGVTLAKKRLTLPGGATVEVDGVSADETIFIEAFAHQGPMKGGQPKKVAQDALKLITIGRARDTAKLYLAFADPLAAASVMSGHGWLAEALRTWGVQVLVVELPADVLAGLRSAQLRLVGRGRGRRVVRRQLCRTCPAAAPPYGVTRGRSAVHISRLSFERRSTTTV